ncbi:hypothetical protein D3C71_1391430 [compost metagenome]
MLSGLASTVKVDDEVCAIVQALDADFAVACLRGNADTIHIDAGCDDLAQVVVGVIAADFAAARRAEQIDIAFRITALVGVYKRSVSVSLALQNFGVVSIELDQFLLEIFTLY